MIVLLPAIALLLSRAPSALANLSFPEPSLWHVLSAALAVACAGMLVRMLGLNWRAAGGSKMDTRVQYWLSVAASIAMLGLQMTQAAGIFATNDLGVYLIGAIWFVVESTHVFWVSSSASLEIER